MATSLSILPNQGLRLAVVGCTHGALDEIYKRVAEIEMSSQIVVDAVLCCGDFQAIRNSYDLQSMVTPQKYRKYVDFYKYYSGEAVAPKLTIFIGGNHEAIVHNRELYYGGWAAPNIYFLGYSGVINLGGLRIAGFSGIYNDKFFRCGHFEVAPYSKNDLHSAMYVRVWELWKLAHLTGRIDAIMSHDWPEYIAHFGNITELLRTNPNFQKSIDDNELGCEAYLALLKHLKPDHWLSGHMHTKFTAVVAHGKEQGNPTKDYIKMLGAKQSVKKDSPIPGSVPKQTASSSSHNGSCTHFLALDKPLPGRQFLDILHFPEASAEMETSSILDLEGNPLPPSPLLTYDLEWLSIIRATHPLFPNYKGGAKVPPMIHPNAIAKHKNWIVENLMGGNANNMEALVIPRSNFIRNAAIHEDGKEEAPIATPTTAGPQTAVFLQWLGLDIGALEATASTPQKKPAAKKEENKQE